MPKLTLYKGRHAGLGSAGAAPNLPTPANIPTGPRYSMFLSQIPLDFADLWLENLLSAAGPLVSMRRVRDAAGMAKPFGFAEYSDLESVLRCLQCINGLKLPSKVSPDQPFAVSSLPCPYLSTFLTRPFIRSKPTKRLKRAWMSINPLVLKATITRKPSR